MPPDAPATTQDKLGVSQPPVAGDTFIPKEDRPWWDEMLRKPDWSAEDRELIAKKFHGYDQGYKTLKGEYAQKFQEISSYEQEIKQLAENLKSSQRPTARTIAAAQAEGERILDRFIADTQDPQTRETLRSLREIIHQETGVGDLKKQLSELSDLVKAQVQSTQTTSARELSKQMSELSKTYGELVDTYKNQIEALGRQYPGFTAEEYLYKVAKPDELRQAVIIQSRRQQKGPEGQEPTKRGVGQVASAEDRPISEKYKGKTAGETAGNFRNAVRDIVEKVYEAKKARGAA